MRIMLIAHAEGGSGGYATKANKNQQGTGPTTLTPRQQASLNRARSRGRGAQWAANFAASRGRG